MRVALRWLRRLLLSALALAAVLLVTGPYEPVEVDTTFDRAQIKDGVTAYIVAREARHDDITPAHRMQVRWYGLDEVPTELAVVYFHGFSATSEDLRPVPQRVAEALRANLVLTRFTGHGRDGAALAQARAGDWISDAAEALAIAREVGHEVVIIATSTGGTLAALAATDPEMRRDLKGIVLVSPNFGINSPLAWVLRLPAARYWLPLVAGPTWSVELRNPAQARHWTTSFPVTALLPVAALARHVAGLDFSAAAVPALFYYSDRDQVVDARATARVAAAWGGPVTRAEPDLGPGVDPLAHVIAGDILSPANTDAAVNLILGWIAGLP